jgi:hypothetical protein
MKDEITTNSDMIKRAMSVIKIRKTENGLFGDVGCALLSAENKVYVGLLPYHTWWKKQ